MIIYVAGETQVHDWLNSLIASRKGKTYQVGIVSGIAAVDRGLSDPNNDGSPLHSLYRCDWQTCNVSSA